MVAPTDPRQAIAQRLREGNAGLCQEWLDRLRNFLPVSQYEIFPSEDLLDHIPDLIAAIAEDLSRPNGDHLSSSIVTAKARELGELRHGQDASVHQLLREYEHLAEVLNAFVATELGRLDNVDVGGAVDLMEQINFAVRILMRTTIDTFVEKFADTIEDQHQRLESFNHMISHELRNPMHSLRLAAELLGSEDGGASETNVHPDVDGLVREGVDRIDTVLTTLERLSQTEALHLHSPVLQEIELAEAINDVAGQLEEAREENGVEVRLPDALPHVVIDLANFSIILNNLLSNAIKFADPSKSRRFVEIELLDEAPEDSLALSVRDNGVGIDAESLPRIFDRNYRARSVGAVDGHGLGLYIVRRCIDAMGGSIYVRSAEGEGTTIFLTVAAEIVGEDTNRRAGD